MAACQSQRDVFTLTDSTLKAVRAAVAQIHSVNNDAEYARLREAHSAYTSSFNNPYNYENNDRVKLFIDRREAAFDTLKSALEAAAELRRSVKSLNAVAAPYGWIVDGSSEFIIM